MIGLLTGVSLRTWLIVATVAGAGAFIGWNRWDAVRDARQAAEADALRATIRIIKEQQERRNDIEKLDDCELLRDAIKRLSGDAARAASEFQRCGEETANGSAENGDVPSEE